MTKKLEALIFDVDGTLADTEEVHRQAFNLAFQNFGLPWYWSPALYEKLLETSGGCERMMKFALAQGESFKRPPDMEEYIVRLHKLKTTYYGQMLVEGRVKLRAGVRRLIDEARQQGIRLAIATSSAYANVKILLDSNLPKEWPSWFEVLATCDIIESKKPSPAVYQFVLQEMGLRADQCVAFEDSYNGNRAALAAGIKSVITTHTFTENDDFSGAALVLDGFGEPDRPCKVNHGELGKRQWLALATLQKLLRNSLRDEIAPAAGGPPILQQSPA